MEPLLFLAHRIPFPPNKGDKIRSYHLLRHLAGRYRVFLGAFVDDPDDMQYAGLLRGLVADAHLERLYPAWGRLRSLVGLARAEALTLGYYRSRAMRRWVARVAGEHRVRKAVAFSSPMAQYVHGIGQLRVVADFCDVDSQKWVDYGGRRPFPASWVYRREGKRLLAYERSTAQGIHATTFVTRAELQLFAGLAPECADRLHVVGNGVDTDTFTPEVVLPSPYPQGETAIVFTGAMDYWPNIDAAQWFASEVLPTIVRARPTTRFYVVGMNPTAEVKALAGRHVTVTGAVPDVRPYVMHASVAVAPLRVARGVQNKILEAMAMGRPVVATTACAAPLTPNARAALLNADDAAEFAARVVSLLEPARALDLGARARAAILRDYAWETNLAVVDDLLDDVVPGGQREPSVTGVSDPAPTMSLQAFERAQ